MWISTALKMCSQGAHPGCGPKPDGAGQGRAHTSPLHLLPEPGQSGARLQQALGEPG